MSDRIDDLVQQVGTVVGRSTATAFVTPEVEDRYFILEPLVVGAALFLLNRYFEGFFEPLEEMGKQNGKAAAQILKDLSKGLLSEPAKDEGRRVVQQALMEVQPLDTAERRAAAEKEVQRVLQEYGESGLGAAKKAAEITGAIFGH